MLECYKQYSAKQWAEIGKYVFHHGRYSAAPLSKHGRCVRQGQLGCLNKFENASHHLSQEQLFFRTHWCLGLPGNSSQCYTTNLDGMRL